MCCGAIVPRLDCLSLVTRYCVATLWSSQNNLCIGLFLPVLIDGIMSTYIYIYLFILIYIWNFLCILCFYKHVPQKGYGYRKKVEFDYYILCYIGFMGLFQIQV